MTTADDSPVTVWDDVRTARRIATLLASRKLGRDVSWDEFDGWLNQDCGREIHCNHCYASEVWRDAKYLGEEL